MTPTYTPIDLIQQAIAGFQAERTQLETQTRQLDARITELKKLVGKANGQEKANGKTPAIRAKHQQHESPKRKMSAKARAAIAKAQKLRWAMHRAQKAAAQNRTQSAGRTAAGGRR